jgi:hypothetical protein
MAADTSADIPVLSRPSQKGSWGFHTLSNEIIIQIIENVLFVKSLLSLSLCSRQLHELTEPILYAKFGQGDAKSLPAFLCRLLARPDLANRVKLFTGTVCNEGPGEQDVSGFTDEDWTRVRAAVNTASINKVKETAWIEAIEEGIWDALTALFLCLTPNLEEIDLEDWGYGYGEGRAPFMDDILERAVGLQNRGEQSPYSLSNLKSVSFSYLDVEDGMSFTDLEPFLRLKSVAELEAFAVSEDTGDFFEHAQPLPFTYWTKNLTLDYTVINHVDMVYRFKAFKCLERLYYGSGPATVGYAPFEPPRMMQAIEHLKPCLKDLTIIIDQSVKDYGAEFDGYPIGSLAGFEKLTSIDVSSHILIGEDPIYDDDDDDDDASIHEENFPSHQRLVDSLPPTLTYLSLRDIEDHHIEHIFDLIAQKHTQTPHLAKLNLHWEGVTYPDKPSPTTPVIHKGFTGEQVDEIIAGCDGAGIEIVMEYPPPRSKFVRFQRQLAGEEVARRYVELGLVEDVKIFRYPYEGLEEFCREHGVDPEGVGYWPER